MHHWHLPHRLTISIKVANSSSDFCLISSPTDTLPIGTALKFIFLLRTPIFLYVCPSLLHRAARRIVKLKVFTNPCLISSVTYPRNHFVHLNHVQSAHTQTLLKLEFTCQLFPVVFHITFSLLHNSYKPWFYKALATTP